MKTFFLLLILLTQMAVAGEKGNGIVGVDEKFEGLAQQICGKIVDDPWDDADEIEITIDHRKKTYDRKEVLDYCCTNIIIGPACYRKVQL